MSEVIDSLLALVRPERLSGHGPHGLPETFNPFTVTPWDTAGNLFGGAASPNDIEQMQTPALQALSTLISTGTKKGLGAGTAAAIKGLYANLPPVVAVEQARGKNSKTYPYEGTAMQALMRYIAGTGMVPRETSPSALERSAYYQKHPLP